MCRRKALCKGGETPRLRLYGGVGEGGGGKNFSFRTVRRKKKTREKEDYYALEEKKRVCRRRRYWEDGDFVEVGLRGEGEGDDRVVVAEKKKGALRQKDTIGLTRIEGGWGDGYGIV